jgi:hypothetical protein
MRVPGGMGGGGRLVGGRLGMAGGGIRLGGGGRGTVLAGSTSLKENCRKNSLVSCVQANYVLEKVYALFLCRLYCLPSLLVSLFSVLEVEVLKKLVFSIPDPDPQGVKTTGSATL